MTSNSKLQVPLEEVAVPSKLREYGDLWPVALKFTYCFLDKRSAKSTLSSCLRNQYGLDRKTARVQADLLIENAISYWSNDPHWNFKRESIFESGYPTKPREFIYNNAFAYTRYCSLNEQRDPRITFTAESYDYLHSPKARVIQEMAPALYNVVRTGDGKPQTDRQKLEKSSEVDRFLSLEKDALPKSALHEVQSFNRPMHGVKEKWIYKDGTLPVHVVPAKLTGSPDRELAEGFLRELKSTFSWHDDESYVAYVGYLLQPLLTHILPGQNPGYSFEGPTKSGKGFLSSVLPGVLYHRPGTPSVVIKKIPQGDYEFEVFLGNVKDTVFVTFDEVILADAAQLKLIDALLTSSDLTIRQLHHGYIHVRNYLTIALTAVAMSVTDETDGRLASIKLTQSSPEKIDAFYRKWATQGPTLLASLFETVQKVKIDAKKFPKIADRRPGFALLAHVLKEGFDLHATYPLKGGNTDLLDMICQLYEESPAIKKSGPWRLYSPKNLQDLMAANGLPRPEKKKLELMIHAALPFGDSTRKAPKLKHLGHQAESGRYYHVEFRIEGKDGRRFIYVQPADTNDSPAINTGKSWATTKTTKTTESTKANFPNRKIH